MNSYENVLYAKSVDAYKLPFYDVYFKIQLVYR